MSKTRIHNEWIMPVSEHRKSCKRCKTKFTGANRQYAWGQYIVGKWFTVLWFCEACFEQEVLSRLIGHIKDCGCTYQFVPRSGYFLPMFLKEHNDKKGTIS